MLLKLVINGKTYESQGGDTWEAFRIIGSMTKDDGIKMLCKGLTIDVYPSRMSRQMGLGTGAYKMTMGRPANLYDLVDIFDFSGDSDIASPSEQDEFFKSWIKSLKSH